VENLLSVGLPALDFARPRGAAGEATGYLFPIGGGDVAGFGDRAFLVALLDRQIANGIIIARHYSQRVYRGSTLHLGVWIDGRLLGVLQFGFAMNPASAGSVVTGTAMNEYLELNRMWLDDAAPRNSESRALAASVRLIRRVRPAVKWIQSFADERCGLFGTVYQAAGFTYHGEHRGIFWELDGEWYHNSLMTNFARKPGPRAQHLLDGRDRAIRHELRQFRYLRFLKPRFAKGCRHPVRPYPKPDYAA
jgi:adenine modification enzyme